MKCPKCQSENGKLNPGKYECYQCKQKFIVDENLSISIPDFSPGTTTVLSDFESNDPDQTMPGKRDRKSWCGFEIGDLILNRYKILSVLGQGGMGVVYRCLDETAGVEIARKAAEKYDGYVALDIGPLGQLLEPMGTLTFEQAYEDFAMQVKAGVAAGGVIASTPALMKLMAHLDYGTKVPDIFKKETLDLMYTAKEGMKTSSGAAWNRYGLGWRVNYPEITSWEAYHGGTLAGVCTIWARSKKNVNGVILCNSRSYDKGIDDEMWFILEDIQKLF